MVIFEKLIKQMKIIKRTVFFAILLAAIINTNTSFSQLRLLIGPVIGYTSPSGDYGGSTTDFYSGIKYGLGASVNYGAEAKLTLGPLNGKLSISYVSMSNSGTANSNQPNSTVDVKNSIFTVGIGTEFGFAIPFSPVRPYAGVDFLISTINGSFQFQNTPTVSNQNSNDVKSASRTGLGFNLGAEYKAGKTITLDFSLHYNMINLFGKKYDGVEGNRINAYTSLNDGTDNLYDAGNVNHPIGSNRSIAVIQIQLGILFGL